MVSLATKGWGENESKKSKLMIEAYMKMGLVCWTPEMALWPLGYLSDALRTPDTIA
jgi:hypothetical protein